MENSKRVPRGHYQVTGYLIFDETMDFTCEVTCVLDVHKTESPMGWSCAGVVSRESLRISFPRAALNEVDDHAEDIRNSYLQVPSSESIALFLALSLV